MNAEKTPTKYRCPQFDCHGKLEIIGGSTTCLGVLGFDDANTITEMLVCDECGRRCARKWSWEEEL